MPKKLLGLREYARHLKVRHSTVQAAVDSGRLSPILQKGQPKFDPAVHDEQYAKSTNPAKQNNKKTEVTSLNGEQKRQKMEAAETLINSRAVRESYQARLAKLDYELKSGRLISADKVKTEAFLVARTVRDTLLNIPDRVSSQIASLTGVQDSRIHDLIAGEIRLVLEELVNANRKKS